MRGVIHAIASRISGKYLARIVLICAAQFAAGKVGDALQTVNDGGIGPVWPASGIALAALLLWDYSVWPGVAAGAFLLAFLSPLPHWAAVLYAAGTTLASAVGVFLLRSIAKFDNSLSHLRDALGLIILGAFVSSIVSASIGASILFANLRSWSGLNTAWLVYWLGDSTGVLLLAPVALTFPNILRTRDRKRITELVVILVLLIISGLMVFGDFPLVRVQLHILTFAVLPFVMWAAIRLGVSATALLIFATGTVATVETALGNGPFTTNTPIMNAVLLDVFFAVVSITGLILAAAIAEREQAERERERLVRERAEAEAQLRFAAIVECSEDAIASGALDGTIVSWNPGAQRLYGYTEAEMLGKSISLLVPPELSDEENKILETLKLGRRVEQLETIRVSKTGQRINVSLSISPIKDSRGAIVGVSGIARDISERKRHEEKLREYERAIENAEEMIAVVSREYRYVIANRQFLKLWNKTHEQVVGHLVKDVLNEGVFEAAVKPKLDECLQGKVVRYETQYGYPGLGERDILVSYFPIEGASGIDRVACILQDITNRKRAEEAVRESEQRFRLLADTAPVLIWMSGTDKLCNYFNQPWLDFTGRSMQEELGTGWAEGVHPEDIQRYLETYRRSFDCREKFRMEYRLRRHDGEYRWILDIGVPRFNQDGSFAGYIDIGIDVTERKAVEAALAKSEEKFSKAFRQSPLALTLTSMKEDRYIDANETFERLTGWRRDEVIGRTPLDISIWIDLAQRVEFTNRFMDEGVVRDFEVHYRRKDGVERVGLASAELIEIENEPCVLGVMADITERKRVEEALRESEEKFRNVFRDAGVGMVVVSPEGRFLAANKAFCDCLGYKEEELLEKTVESVTFAEDWPAFSQKLAETLTEGRGFQWFEKRCLHKSGRIVYTESSASVIRGREGDPQYLVGQVLDITERKQAEEALADVSRKLVEAQDHERARLARELHDDISQRLAMLAIELEQLSGDDSEFRSRVQELRKQTTEIANDVQALSHDLHSSQLEYLGVVAGMKSWCKEFGKRQRMEIDCRHDVRSPLPQQIGLCLFRVLQEALHNAAKHSGVKRIEVQLHEEPGEIHLIVSDSGRGFDIEAVKQGKGLGLTSMRERIRLVNGAINIQSQPMRGTTIHVQVPFPSEHNSQRAAG